MPRHKLSVGVLFQCVLDRFGPAFLKIPGLWDRKRGEWRIVCPFYFHFFLKVDVIGQSGSLSMNCWVTANYFNQFKSRLHSKECGYNVKLVKLEFWNRWNQPKMGRRYSNTWQKWTNTEAAVSAAHLVVCSLLHRIPFMLKGILKSVGSLVDKLRTCIECKWFHPDQNIQD